MQGLRPSPGVWQNRAWYR